MGKDIIVTAFSGVMPYLTPLIFIVGAVMTADKLINLVVTAFTLSSNSSKRRAQY